MRRTLTYLILSLSMSLLADAQSSDIGVSQILIPVSYLTYRPSQSFSPSAKFTNVGASDQSNVPVRFEIINHSGSVVYVSDKIISSISPSFDTLITFDFISLGLPVGIYTSRVTQLLLGDINPANDKLIDTFFVNWFTASPMSTQRRNHTATMLYSGIVLITGGDQPGSVQKSCELFIPSMGGNSGNWVSTDSMLVARSLHTATILPSGKVLVTGGVNSTSQPERRCEIFDPFGNFGAGKWDSTKSIGTGRYIHTATMLTNGKVLVVGGISPSGVTRTCELFDPQGDGGKGTWSSVASLNTSRAGHTATLLSNGTVLITGGEDSTYSPVSSCEIFNPTANGGTGSWTVTTSMSVARIGHQAVPLTVDRVLITGGGSATCEIFESNGTWTTPIPMIQERSEHAASQLASGEVLITGGGNSSCEVFVPNANNGLGQWRLAPSMTSSRTAHTVTTLSSGKLLVSGGFDGSQSLNTSEVFDTSEAGIIQLPTNIAISALWPDTLFAGVPFSVVIESRDDSDHPQNVNDSTTVNLSLGIGVGLLGGTLGGTLLQGDNRVIISGVTYSTADEGIQIMSVAESGMNLSSGTSSPFNVLGVPKKIDLVLPQDKAVSKNDSIVFSWNAGQYQVSNYWLEISYDTLGSSTIIDSVILDTTKTLGQFPDNAVMWWRVRAANIFGWGSFSGWNEFSTSIPPATPKSLEAMPHSKRVSLFWIQNLEADIVGYYIYMGIDSTLITLVDSTLSKQDTTKELFNLLNGHQYHFSVAAIDSSRNLSERAPTITASPVLYTEMQKLGSDSTIYFSQEWGDYNNDGWYDLLLTVEKNATAFTIVYENDQIGRFEDIQAPIDGILYGNAKWCDFNNDNLLDVIIIGRREEFVHLGTTKIFRNLGGGAFSDIQAGLTPLASGGTGYGDYDNDGDLDVVVSGWTGSSTLTQLFRNDDDGTFSLTNVVLPPMQNGSIIWADYDKDEDLDLILAGGAYPEWYCRIYRNDGPGTGSSWIFTDINAPFEPVNSQSVSMGDYDSDGYLDIAITGYNPVDHVAIAKIYRNQSGKSFVQANVALDPCTGTVRWGDYDNDGTLDLSVMDCSEGLQPVRKLYQNDGLGNFTEDSSKVSQNVGTIAWSDYDRDTDLDIVGIDVGSIGFYSTKLYRNNIDIINKAPNAPSSLTSTPNGNSVWLRWKRSTDNETPSAGLSYNLSIGTMPGGTDVMSPSSDLATGFRRIPQLGNVSMDTSWTIRNLPAGKYYWKVQAIDNSFLGSEFAPIDSFEIISTGIPPDLKLLPKTFTLSQSFPNPFNPTATIKYELPVDSRVLVNIYNVIGERVATLVDGNEKAGYKETKWIATNMPSGLYFYRLEAVSMGDASKSFTSTKKMLLLK